MPCKTHGKVGLSFQPVGTEQCKLMKIYIEVENLYADAMWQWPGHNPDWQQHKLMKSSGSILHQSATGEPMLILLAGENASEGEIRVLIDKDTEAAIRGTESKRQAKP